jgi:hypothetical protein
MGARGANEIGEERRELVAHSSPEAKFAEAETSPLQMPAAHHEDAALRSDAYAVDVAAIEFRCTDRLVHRRALVEVRFELLALVELEVHS